MNILGIAAHYHESAACLLRDGRLVAYGAEERFSRVKHDPSLPVQAVRFCLDRGGLGLDELDAVAYYERPAKKLARQLWMAAPAHGVDEPLLATLDVERQVRERLSWDGPLLCFDHHDSHAASSFDFSGFDEAAVMTIDSVGTWTTTAYFAAARAALDRLESVRFPHSLGLLYSAVTNYLGFRVNSAEYKVMGLAAYGRPTLIPLIEQLVHSGDDGQFRLDLRYFDFRHPRRMYSPALCDLFGAPPRAPESEVTTFHRDLACSLQRTIESILLAKVRYLATRVRSRHLCLAGGVALNSVANGRIAREGPFEQLFVQPAAGDAGGCLGAAALAHRRLTGRPPANERLPHVYYGPAFATSTIARMLRAAGIDADDFTDRESALLEAVVDRLERGEVVGWMHGPMELGPRALGGRSILADPRDAQVRDRINAMVKKREMFRPFAPSVLDAARERYFDLDHPSPFMLETCAVRTDDLPAITHVDGSARPHTVTAERAPRYARLLAAFGRRTGCPVLLNTSLNVRGEPIVATPVDALRCAAHAGLDALVLEDFLVDRRAIPAPWAASPPRRTPAIDPNVYTFV